MSQEKSSMQLSHSRRLGMTSPSKIPRSLIVIAILAVVLFGGGFAAGQDVDGWLHPDRHLLEKQATLTATGIGVVTPDQVLKVGADNRTFVDVRARDAYEFAHIDGAMAMPEAEIDTLASKLPTDRTIVLYCTCPDEKTSLRAAQTLKEFHGVHNLVVLKGGMLAYRTAGGDLSSDATDSAIESQGCGCKVTSPAFKLWVMNNETNAIKPKLTPFS
jgi:rhodanese-related sulfurtransferase